MLLSYFLVSASFLVVGYLLSYALFKKKGKQLRGSILETKILFWVPIFGVVILLAYSPAAVQVAILIAVAVGIVADLVGRQAVKKNPLLVLAVCVLLFAGLVASYLVVQHSKELFLAVWLASVISDVVAFFSGNFAGRHRLPKSLNKNKSWEGVFGQFIGAAIGVAAFNLFVGNVGLLTILLVGFGSASGDLLNSRLKRSLGIKDWSNRIPGHGGFIDRLSSVSLSFLLVYIFLV